MLKAERLTFFERQKLETAIQSCDALGLPFQLCDAGQVGASIGAFVAGIGFRRWEIEKFLFQIFNCASGANLFGGPHWAASFVLALRVRHSKSILGFYRLASEPVDRHVRSGGGECSGGRECPLAARRLLNYELAVTTAVKKATVMIRINIVTALIACVVISLLLPLSEGNGRSGRPLGSPG
jgi:hypothetical protein